jgi:phytoene dehydrogenase-like protein
MTLDAPLMMAGCPTNKDPGLAPPGWQLVTGLVIVPSAQLRERAPAAGDALRAWLEQVFPGLSTRADWERRLVLPVVDGVLPRVGQSLVERPAVVSPHVAGLYLVSDAVAAPGSGGDIAFHAALRAVEHSTANLSTS